MNVWKKALRFALCLLPVGLIGGWFAVKMQLLALDPAAVEQAVREAGSLTAVKAVSTLLSAIYTVLCGFFGCVFAEKVGLMRPLRPEKKPLICCLSAAVLGGAILSLDAWTFARWIPALGASYAAAGSFDAATWIASILYGGISEEIMIRLFLMSGLALLGRKLLRCGEGPAPERILIGANGIAALAFAALHLPGTAQLFGALTPLLVFRCFLLNGAAGLLFGRFYRKYGIQYAILAHMLFHLVSRTIWLITLP